MEKVPEEIVNPRGWKPRRENKNSRKGKMMWKSCCAVRKLDIQINQWNQIKQIEDWAERDFICSEKSGSWMILYAYRFLYNFYGLISVSGWVICRRENFFMWRCKISATCLCWIHICQNIHILSIFGVGRSGRGLDQKQNARRNDEALGGSLKFDKPDVTISGTPSQAEKSFSLGINNLILWGHCSDITSTLNFHAEE